MTPQINKGHYYLFLSELPRRKPCRPVHQLVLEAFVGPMPEGMEGCHNNGDPLDNRVTNLRWDTHAENNRDMLRHRTHFHANQTHCKYGHELTPDNLKPARGRQCRVCAGRRNAEYKHRKFGRPIPEKYRS